MSCKEVKHFVKIKMGTLTSYYDDYPDYFRSHSVIFIKEGTSVMRLRPHAAWHYGPRHVARFNTTLVFIGKALVEDRQ